MRQFAIVKGYQIWIDIDLGNSDMVYINHVLSFYSVLKYRCYKAFHSVSPLRFTGEVRAVEGTPFDLRKPGLVSSRLKELSGPGFDHNFCLASPGDPWKERLAARCDAFFTSVNMGRTLNTHKET